MRLLIFTPAKRASSIGGCSGLISRELLAQGHGVAIVRTEKENLLNTETHDFGVDPVPWTDTNRVSRAIREADGVVYQIGNNYEFHRGGLEWLTRSPGIVILHDFFVGDLFRGWAQFNKKGAAAIVRGWYGEKTARGFFDPVGHETFLEKTIDAAPMTEWVCSMAESVITHSSWGCPRVLASCPGPVRVVALTHNKQPGPTGLQGWADSRPPAAGFTILTIGHVNPNKRVESVVRAIAGSPILRERSVYRLVGAISREVSLELSRLAEAKGVNLIISGEVDDETLARAIEESDVISCLRWPTIEAASGSLVEALLSGKPTIVTDTGFYSELPSSSVLKVRPEDEINDIRAALEKLFEDPGQRQALGEEARRWAAQTFTTDNYVRELINAVKETATVRPILRAVDLFSRILLEWSPDGAPSPDMDEALTAPLGIFGPPQGDEPSNG